MATVQGEGQRVLNLTVLKVEGLSQHRNRNYYVKCTIGSMTGETRTVKQEERATDIIWNQNFSFVVDEDSKLLLRLLVSSSHRDVEKGRIELGLIDIQFGQDVQCSLTKTNGSTSWSTDASITIRLRWATQLEAVESIVNGTAEAAQNRISQKNKLCEASGTISAGGSVAASWGLLVEKIAVFDKIVTALSDIHPYAKAALSIVKGLTDVFIKQTKRDDKILSLVETMSDAFDLIREGEPLNEGEVYKKIFKTMALQTMECGYFIQTYIKDGFCKRAVRSLNPRIDKAIDDFQTQFNEIGSSLKSHTVLDTAVQVYRMIDTVQNINATINLNEIAYAEGMRFNLESCCLPDTRKEILDDIIEWANNTETENRVFILTGLAGSGKSSIAHSVASYFDSLSRLGSSFFCSRSNLVNSQPEKIFSTIARDLADQNDQVLRKLTEVVKMNKSLRTTRSVREQFHNLIRKATDGLTMIGPLVIVIDALDECEGEDRLQRELMRILALEASTLPKNFRIFLTSRSSNMYVEGAFGMDTSVIKDGVVHRELLERVSQVSTRHDIFIFIGEELSDVASSLSKSYPDWQAILTDESGGLFIYASTACKFIRGNSINRGTHPIERYERLRKARSVGSSTGGAEPLKSVYELYCSILMSTFNPDDAIVMDRFRKVLGIIVTAFTTLSTNVIEELLAEDKAGRTIISELGSLLIGWDNAKLPVQVLHASFPDYLTNRDFSSYFYIDDKYRHSQMALFCLKLMNRKLEVKKFNICEFEDYYVLYNDMQPGELERRREEHISEALQYVCRHWPTHIAQMDPNNYGIIKKELQNFLFEGKHLMQWIEVLSILKYVDGVKTSMRALFEWTKCIKETDPTTHRLIYDCCRFLEGFTYRINLGPLHMYLSALPYVPSRTALYHLYSRISGLEPIVVFEPEKNLKWSLRRSQLPMNGGIIAPVFSPDGTLIACMASSGEIQVFDLATSAPRGNAIQLKRGKMEGDGGESLDYNNTTIALSPDCSKIAFSHPKVIEVRDIASGAYIHSEEEFGTYNMKIPIVFQSDGVVVTCRPNGINVELWRLELDSRKATIHTFAVADRVERVALSPNGVYAGGVSCKRTVSVWNVNTKEEIAQFNVPGDKWDWALGVSSSGSVAVAYEDRIAMWSREEGRVIWDKESGYVLGILMPLSTECGHFVTRGVANQVWDMATGEHREHESWIDDALAISPDGQFLVTEKGVIYSVNGDEEEPDWEPNSDAEANKYRLEELEWLRHVIVSPSGSVAASSNGKTVFVWDQLGEADAAKQSLQAHTYVSDVRIAPEGLKLARQNHHNEILVWTRPSVSANFEQLGECKFESEDAAKEFLNNSSQWGISKDSESTDPAPFALASQMDSEQPLISGDLKSDAAESSAEDPIFAYKVKSGWVTIAGFGGRKVWWIPEGFRGYSSQRGRKIVVYNTGHNYYAFVIIFKYTNNVHSS